MLPRYVPSLLCRSHLITDGKQQLGLCSRLSSSKRSCSQCMAPAVPQHRSGPLTGVSSTVVGSWLGLELRV